MRKGKGEVKTSKFEGASGGEEKPYLSSVSNATDQGNVVRGVNGHP
jgi:hypothetical protein